MGVPCHATSQELGLGRSASERAPASNSREGKGHQCSADHDEIQDVPQVPEIGALVKNQPQVDHLWQGAKLRQRVSKAARSVLAAAEGEKAAPLSNRTSLCSAPGPSALSRAGAIPLSSFHREGN